MWKKILASMAILTLFATNVAFADAKDYLSNFTVSETVIDTNVNETAEVTLEVIQDTAVRVRVTNSSNQTVATLANDVAAVDGDVLTYTWHGTDGNVAGAAALPEGTYFIKAFAIHDNILDYLNSKSVEIAYGSASAPVISGIVTDPTKFSPGTELGTDISFEVDQAAYLTVVIEDEEDNVVATFADYDGNWVLKNSDKKLNWDGKDDDGDVVADGTYTVKISADSGHYVTTASADVEVLGTGVGKSNGIIVNAFLSPANSWDPEDEDLEINFDLEEDASLYVEAIKLDEDGNETSVHVEILDDNFADDDDYEEEWDGTDDDGDEVNEGEWIIVIRANGDRVDLPITIEYDEPMVVQSLVTKDSFDPEHDEFTQLLVKVDERAAVTVDLYKGHKKEFTLADEVFVHRNRWYSFMWDGKDQDGEIVTNGDYKFRIKTENLTDDDVFKTTYESVELEEDTVSQKKTNLTNDFAVPAIYDEDFYDGIEFNYTIDDDAEITLEIFEGMSASGKEEIELMNEVDHNDGTHFVTWNGRNKYNKTLDNGVYTYKIQAEDGSQKDSEYGRFVVGKIGEGFYLDNFGDEDDFVDVEDDFGTGDKGDDFIDIDLPQPPSVILPVNCANYYWDVNQFDHDTCEAIAWATETEIFSGYADGSFRPNQVINRAETLKVIFEAFRNAVHTSPSYGSSLGFRDVDPYAWYMPYASTAKAYGMLHGYLNQTEARLNNTVNRVEFLKFALEASDAFTWFETPGYEVSYYADVNKHDVTHDWFFDYAGVAYEYNLFGNSYGYASSLMPAKGVTRGEVAVALYRMYLNGMLAVQ